MLDASFYPPKLDPILESDYLLEVVMRKGIKHFWEVKMWVLVQVLQEVISAIGSPCFS